MPHKFHVGQKVRWAKPFNHHQKEGQIDTVAKLTVIDGDPALCLESDPGPKWFEWRFEAVDDNPVYNTEILSINDVGP